MLDFYEVWGKEILKKRIAIGVAVFFFLLSVFVFFSSIFLGGEKKTLEDYAFVYAVERFNYTPQSVERAYFSKYQYQPIGYQYLVEREIEEVKNLSLASFFKPTRIKVDENERKVVVEGVRITGKLRQNTLEDLEVKEVKITLRYNQHGFSVEKIE